MRKVITMTRTNKDILEIQIDHYKDIFNRSGQDFQTQKLSMNIILAKKIKPFLYPASDMVQNVSLGPQRGTPGSTSG